MLMATSAYWISLKVVLPQYCKASSHLQQHLGWQVKDLQQIHLFGIERGFEADDPMTWSTLEIRLVGRHNSSKDKLLLGYSPIVPHQSQC